MPNALIDEIRHALSNLERRGRLKVDQAVPRATPTGRFGRRGPFWDLVLTAPHLASDATGRAELNEKLLLRIDVGRAETPGQLRLSALGEPLPVHPRFSVPSLQRMPWSEAPQARWQTPWIYRENIDFPRLLECCVRDAGFLDEGLGDQIELWRERRRINPELLNRVQQRAAAALEGIDFAKDAKAEAPRFRVRDESDPAHTARESGVQRQPSGRPHVHPPGPEPIKRPPRKFQIREESDSSEVAHRRLPEPREILLQSRAPRGLNQGPSAFIRRSAAQRIFDHIGWGDHDRSDNRVEQGGILIGRSYFDPDARTHFAIADDVIAAEGAIGSAGYLSMTHGAWRTMFERFDELVTLGRIDPACYIVGWYHTHPNSLDVFMSGTDRDTQRRYFSRDWQCAVVLNPHKQIWDVFFGAACHEGRGVICDL